MTKAKRLGLIEAISRELSVPIESLTTTQVRTFAREQTRLFKESRKREAFRLKLLDDKINSWSSLAKDARV